MEALAPQCETCAEPLGEPVYTWPGKSGGAICQNCWEIESDAAWWDMVRRLSSFYDPDGSASTDAL